MKKEIFAGLILVLMFAASVVNINYLEHFCDETVDIVDASLQYAESGNWPAAVHLAEQARDRWQRNRGYTHIFIRHTELDATTEAFHEYLTCLYGESADALHGLGLALKDRITAVLEMERVNLGTIF